MTCPVYACTSLHWSGQVTGQGTRKNMTMFIWSGCTTGILSFNKNLKEQQLVRLFIYYVSMMWIRFRMILPNGSGTGSKIWPNIAEMRTRICFILYPDPYQNVVDSHTWNIYVDHHATMVFSCTNGKYLHSELRIVIRNLLIILLWNGKYLNISSFLVKCYFFLHFCRSTNCIILLSKLESSQARKVHLFT